jgi:DNA invertase Pin-like site-specific DNA recombinase
MEPGDTLVVWRMDRLARSVSDLIKLMEDLREREINFISLTERIDTSTPQGKLLFNITAAFAQFERDLAQYRTTEGMKRKMATGWKPGPKRILTEAQEDQIVKWRDEGLTAPQIVAKVQSRYKKKISQRTVKLTYDRVAARKG